MLAELIAFVVDNFGDFLPEEVIEFLLSLIG